MAGVSVTKPLTLQNYHGEIKQVMVAMQQERKQRFLYHWGLARTGREETEKIHQFILHANNPNEKAWGFWW